MTVVAEGAVEAEEESEEGIGACEVSAVVAANAEAEREYAEAGGVGRAGSRGGVGFEVLRAYFFAVSDLLGFRCGGCTYGRRRPDSPCAGPPIIAPMLKLPRGH